MRALAITVLSALGLAFLAVFIWLVSGIGVHDDDEGWRE